MYQKGYLCNYNLFRIYKSAFSFNLFSCFYFIWILFWGDKQDLNWLKRRELERNCYNLCCMIFRGFHNYSYGPEKLINTEQLLCYHMNISCFDCFCRRFLIPGLFDKVSLLLNYIIIYLVNWTAINSDDHVRRWVEMKVEVARKWTAMYYRTVYHIVSF